MAPRPPVVTRDAKRRWRVWAVALLAALTAAAVGAAVLAIPRGSAFDRAAEVARIEVEIASAFVAAGAAEVDLESLVMDEPCPYLLPEPWKGTHSVIRVTTDAAVEAEDVIAALGSETNRGATWVEVAGEAAAHTVAFRHGGNARVTVSSQTGCYGE